MEENHPYPDIHRRLEYNLRGRWLDSVGLADSVWLNVVFGSFQYYSL